MLNIRFAGVALAGFLVAAPALAEDAPFLNPKLSVEERAADLLGRLTLEEKVSLLSGGTAFGTQAIPRLGIPALQFTDGPNGVRSNDGEPSTAFPVGVAMAATWNPALIADVGKAMGQEAHALHDGVLLGPDVNIQRSPLAGRNFESFSEDPVLAGKIGIGYVRGVQSEGVGVSVKHFAANNQEFERFRGSSNVDERTLREIYLPAFEMIVKEAKPWTVMAAYNRLNGVYASENPWLLDTVLKTEWGFDGVAMSDWSATHSIVPPVAAGLDLEMPGPAVYFGNLLTEAVKTWQIDPAAIDDHAGRILRLILRAGLLDGKPVSAGEINTPRHQQVAQAAAEDAITLLKNDGNLLPLDPKKIRSIAVIGPNGDVAVAQGGGSSHVTPARLISPYDAVREAAGNGVRLSYAEGAANEDIAPVCDPRMVSPTEARDVTGLKVSYYGNTEFMGPPVKTEINDYFMKLNFGERLTAGLKGQFSARWEGFFWAPKDGEYQFSLMASGAMKLMLDGKTLISNDDQPRPVRMGLFGGAGEHTAKIVLQAGKPYPIRMDYVQGRLPLHFLRFGVRQPTGAIEEAVRIARDSDVAVVFVGSTATSETEGQDRPDMDLFGRQNELVEAVLAANRRSIIVLNNGGPVTMPWIGRAPAVLEAWFPGQEGATAIANILFGKVNPSGRLPVTFPRRLEDNPAYLYYPGNRDENYGEGIFVGYRYYDRKKVEPLFPFGYGLSYTKFDFTALQAPDSVKTGQPFDVALKVTNSGARGGQETVQLYVGEDKPTEMRPVKELKAFQKVSLAPGETKIVKLSLTPRDLSYYDVRQHGWVNNPGSYTVSVGASSADIRLQKHIQVGSGLSPAETVGTPAPAGR
jgi:beta-glucosidase